MVDQVTVGVPLIQVHHQVVIALVSLHKESSCLGGTLAASIADHLVLAQDQLWVYGVGVTSRSQTFVRSCVLEWIKRVVKRG